MGTWATMVKTRKKLWYSIFVFSMVVAVHPLPRSLAQETDSEQKVVDEELLTLQKQLKSPRDTVLLLLQSMEKGDFELAYKCLDLSDLDTATASAKKQTYCVKLQLALTKYLSNFDLIALSGDPEEEERPYPPSSNPDLEGIHLVRTSDDLWVFSKSTIEVLDGDSFDFLLADNQTETEELTKSLSIPLLIQQQFPESWWDTTFLLKDYQWLCLLILLFAGLLIGQAAKYLLDYITKIWFRMTRTDVDDQPRIKLWTPIVALLHIWVWYFGTKSIDLPSGVMGIVLPVLTFFAVVAAVWCAFRLIDLLSNYLAKKAKLTPSRYDDSLVPLIGSVLKFVAIGLGIILFVDVFEKDWKAVLGGFGVVGIAVAIAAKDMLGNVFGSITVLGDRPFEVGDWVVIDGKVEGTVEHVGIRSSRLRTFHNSEIVVPNSLLTTAIVDNMGRRRYRRFKTKLQVRYDTTAEQLEAFCAGIRKLIDDSPYAKNENAHVYVNDFAESSIDILLYLFFDCGDWSTELRERHCLLKNILKLAEGLGIGFAFPTRTLEMESKDNVSPPFVAKNGQSSGDKGREIAEKINRENT